MKTITKLSLFVFLNLNFEQRKIIDGITQSNCVFHHPHFCIVLTLLSALRQYVFSHEVLHQSAKDYCVDNINWSHFNMNSFTCFQLTYNGTKTPIRTVSTVNYTPTQCVPSQTENAYFFPFLHLSVLCAKFTTVFRLYAHNNHSKRIYKARLL